MPHFTRISTELTVEKRNANKFAGESSWKTTSSETEGNAKITLKWSVGIYVYRHIGIF
jgi:hypothetical protein